MKYDSITTEGVQHDAANAITELIILNNDLMVDPFPWKVGKPNHKKWVKTVGAVKKLMGRSFELTHDQLAFYVHKCRPKGIDSKEFAKMAVVAKKLLLKMDLAELMEAYRIRKSQLKPSVFEKITYKCEVVAGPRSLMDLIKELESGEKTKS